MKTNHIQTLQIVGGATLATLAIIYLIHTFKPLDLDKKLGLN